MRNRIAANTALSCALVASCANSQSVLLEDGQARIRTQSGVVVGTTAKGVSSFKGGPYAQPLGNLRWASPQSISWTGERQAKQFALPCPQPVNAGGRPNGAAVAESGPAAVPAQNRLLSQPTRFRQHVLHC
jgi:hypothetical protein